MPLTASDIAAHRALAGLGLVGLEDPAADPVIVNLMRVKPAAGTNWMQSITNRNLRAWPEGSSRPEVLAFRCLAV